MAGMIYGGRGTTQTCRACDKTIYLVDQLTADNRVYHRACFRRHHCNSTLKVAVDGNSYHKPCIRCAHGGCVISPSNYVGREQRIYCRHHHTQLFKQKGNFSQLGKKENDNGPAARDGKIHESSKAAAAENGPVAA